jgi:hypothetical protein
MSTQAIISISILLLVIVLSNTMQAIMYNRLRRRHYRMQDYCREKQRNLNLEIDNLREQLWYKENKNAPNPTLDILQAGRFDPVVCEKLRPGEPDPRD